jgi:hypothetical protein
MNTDKKIAQVVGSLFLTALVTNAIGSELMETSIFAPDYLLAVSANKTQMIIGVILELICAAAVIGIPVMMYPILKQYNKRIALGYLGFRLIEPAIAINAKSAVCKNWNYKC